MPFLKAVFDKGRGGRHEDVGPLGGRRRHDGLRRRRRLRWLTSKLPLHGFNWELASLNARLLCIESVSLCKCGFPAAQIHFQPRLIAKSPVSTQRREAGVGSQSILLRAVEQPHLNAETAAHVWRRALGRRVGGLRGSADGGCWAAVGARWRAEAPEPPPAAPSFAWQLCSFRSRQQGVLGAALPAMAGLGGSERRTSQCRGGGGGQPSGLPSRGRRWAEPRGWATSQEQDNPSARAIVRPVFFYGVGGRWERSEHYSHGSGTIQNEAEVRAQARDEGVRNG